ncbi:MAG: 3-phosphoserine/phosphohydroxythreonine transaminase [Atopobiaceae bacterium]|uniref:3-phosphoserine/phosphohydroxythreonine transaminase n=1 Tax=Atopobiaceae TaxID=1643824 RepID=UPI000D78D343|nr:3-phosphoserine/phosphohydroxythreonine transaminase [Atopobiaceae bacterium]PWM34323.1 MAG: 3-phosphoserine/phosphohydroxythreonine aminotransferase [Coriobacteriia bacterium]
MSRVYNFSAGPAVLPEEVLRQCAASMLDYDGTGMSVMEMSHRSPVFQKIIEEAEADLRSLMGIPDDYKVLFLQGGDSLLFSTVFMNLATNGKADYVVTGNWSKKAYEQGVILGDAKLLATSADKKFSYVPDVSDLDIRPDASFVYICQNETITGTRYPELPDTKGHVLVADQSSMFLSEPVDVSRYGLIHAGVQKNVGPAGVQIVIVREDLIPDDLPGVPTMLRLKTHADAGSLYDTPNCWGIYVCGLVFKWIRGLGGLEAMAERNRAKARVLYDFLNESALFSSTVEPRDRSIMNVPFVTGDKDLDAEFIADAAKEGLVNLKGHRLVGGMRASIYNAMPPEGVDTLVSFMKKFEASHK